MTPLPSISSVMTGQRSDLNAALLWNDLPVSGMPAVPPPSSSKNYPGWLCVPTQERCGHCLGSSACDVAPSPGPSHQHHHRGYPADPPPRTEAIDQLPGVASIPEQEWWHFSVAP